jgi:hypothetical protein
LETIINKQNNKQFAKFCKKGRGRLIKWDISQNTFCEIDTNDGHRYPNCNPNQRQPPLNLNRNITREQQLYVDTIGPKVIEIRSAVQDIRQLLTQEKERGVY